MLFKKKIDTNFLQDNAPTVMFWVASIALVFFEARVLDVMYTLTKSYLLTIGALFATGAMFFVWKIAFQYTLASSRQVTLASVGMALALLASAVFGGMDFFVKGGLKIDTGADTFSAVDLLFWGIPTLSVVHLVMALFFWYLDPVITSKRKRKEADDDAKFAADSMTQANELLEKRRALMDRYVETALLYGEQAAQDMLDSLGIDKDQFKSVVIKNPEPEAGHGAVMDGHGQKPAGHGQPAMTIPAGSNGHGGAIPANGGSSNFPTAV